MKVLCLGNNHKHTDDLTNKLGKNHGLISNLDIKVKDGFYHTSVLDLTNSEILELAKQFERVVVLDQPIEQWNHPDEFHATQAIAKRIGSKVRWQNSDGKLQLEYWEDLVKKNKSFCIFPFIELLTMNGHTTVCCRSQTPVQSIKKLENFATDKEYNKIRKDMLQGNSVHKHCKLCYELEDKNIKSARQEETVEWAMRLNLKTIEDLTKIKQPVYYEVRASNTCNIMCRTCSPLSSSLIEKEWKQIGLVPKDYTQHYSNFDIVDILQIQKLYVAGGEPTAMPDFYKFLKKCIDMKVTNFEFQVNTNAMKVSSLLLDLGKQFKNLNYIVSIDGFRQANDYTRWRSKWKTIIDNAHKLIKNGHKVTFNSVLSVYTVFDYHKLIHFLDKEFPDCLIHGTLGEETFGIEYSPFVFKYTQEQISNLESIKNTNIYANSELFASFIDGAITTARQSTNKHKILQKFFQHNDTLDSARNSKLFDYIPALEDVRVCIDKY